MCFTLSFVFALIDCWVVLHSPCLLLQGAAPPFLGWCCFHVLARVDEQKAPPTKKKGGEGTPMSQPHRPEQGSVQAQALKRRRSRGEREKKTPPIHPYTTTNTHTNPTAPQPHHTTALHNTPRCTRHNTTHHARLSIVNV